MAVALCHTLFYFFVAAAASALDDSTVLLQRMQEQPRAAPPVSLLATSTDNKQGDIFEDMVDGINLAINSLNRGFKNATRGVIHQAKTDLAFAGKQFSEGMEKTMREAIRHELAQQGGTAKQEGKVLSLLGVEESTEQGDIFKDMVHGINLAIDSMSRGLKNATRGVVHQAKAELEQAGKEFSEGMEKTMREAIHKEITLQDEVVQQAGKAIRQEIAPQDGATKPEGKALSLLAVEGSAMQGDIFQDMVHGINLAIDSISRGLKNATRGVVHEAKAELEQAGKQFSEGMEKTMREAIRREVTLQDGATQQAPETKGTSLLDLAEGSTHESARQGDIFKDMVHGINLAIDSISRGLKNATRGVVHEAKAELEQAGKQFSEGMEKTMREAIRREITVQDESVQQEGNVVQDTAAKPEGKVLSLLSLGEGSAQESDKQGDIFKDMVQGINLAIDSISRGLKNATRGVVHQAKADLEEAGKQFSEGMEKTMREAIREEISLEDSAQKPQAVNLVRPVSLLGMEKGSWIGGSSGFFEDMVQGINLAIDSVSRGFKNATRGVVHQAKAELEEAGKQFSEGMEKTMREAIRKEINLVEAPASEGKVVSLLGLDENGWSKGDSGFFSDMVHGINLAIDAMSKGLKNATRQVVHEAKTELEHAGKEFSEGMEKTMREAIRQEITVQDGETKQADKEKTGLA